MAKDKNQNKFSFILYEKQNSPKYFEISKSMLRIYFFVLPIVALLSLASIIIGAIYFQNIKNFIKRRESRTIIELKSKNQELSIKHKKLETMNSDFQNKLASTSKEGLSILNMVRFTSGQTDKSDRSTILVMSPGNTTNINPDIKNNKIHLRFNLVNNSGTGKRQAGFLFVIMKIANSVHFYPNKSLTDEKIELIFNRGEYFGFEKLRPVHATFPATSMDGKILFKILLFSRLGDLIHKQDIKLEKFERKK
ncbi:MAG: hypothetical protein KAQ98_12105 [Bacteriovoracaceae bacterium]|nr:hypothetical protein [Bacteriovoracaceae bacterium]